MTKAQVQEFIPTKKRPDSHLPVTGNSQDKPVTGFSGDRNSQDLVVPDKRLKRATALLALRAEALQTLRALELSTPPFVFGSSKEVHLHQLFSV